MGIEIRNHGGSHSYRKVETGEKVPSVTSAKDGGLPKPGLMKWQAEETAAYAVDHWDELAKLPPVERYRAIKKAPYLAMNRAAARGSTVHKFAERILAGETVTVPDPLIGYVRSAAAFIQEFDLQVVHSEVVVHSADEADHAGKLDVLGSVLLPDLPEYEQYERDEDGRVPVIVDWKTSASGVFGEVAYQLAAYRHSRWMVLADGTQIEMPWVQLTIAVHLTPEGYTAWAMETGDDVYQDFLFIKEVSRAVEDSRYLRGDPLIPPGTISYEITKVDQ